MFAHQCLVELLASVPSLFGLLFCRWFSLKFWGREKPGYGSHIWLSHRWDKERVWAVLLSTPRQTFSIAEERANKRQFLCAVSLGCCESASCWEWPLVPCHGQQRQGFSTDDQMWGGPQILPVGRWGFGFSPYFRLQVALYFFIFFKPHLAVIRAYSWLCTHESLLVSAWACCPTCLL